MVPTGEAIYGYTQLQQPFYEVSAPQPACNINYLINLSVAAAVLHDTQLTFAYCSDPHWHSSELPVLYTSSCKSNFHCTL